MISSEPPLQLVAINVMNMVVVIFQGQVKPFKTLHENRMDIFNEAMVMFITYHLFMFTDALPDMDAQYLIGWSFVLMLAAMLIGNSYFVIKGMIMNTKLLVVRKLKEFELKKKQSDFLKIENIEEVKQQIQKERFKSRRMSKAELKDLFQDSIEVENKRRKSIIIP
mmetsp:Transcript_11864/g.18305  ORF Transcript_11864/g.18305 Transcript_11864/m.18305 type:complete len:166 (+) Transcript_11864:1334-1831(+)